MTRETLAEAEAVTVELQVLRPVVAELCRRAYVAREVFYAELAGPDQIDVDHHTPGVGPWFALCAALDALGSEFTAADGLAVSDWLADAEMEVLVRTSR